ncbi:MAG: ATP phosphoribosyltransferase, partial [Candidatus Hydrothermarchaeota archaeon]|nr:ATP phosphoribosyltransferase [Candidatus Hydrothermarchaeota archaeon]
MKKPTVSHLFNNQSNSTEYYAVETVVPKKEVNVLIPKLKEKGAEDILEMNISKIVK